MSAWKNREHDPRIEGIASSMRVISNFPKPGFKFKDITTLLLDPKAFKNTVDLFVERYAGKDISVVAGVEARGFIFGPPIALAIGAKFVPLRKPKKLPGFVISEKYVLEYGSDCLEMHIEAVQPGERALVVDDLVATGGTLCAAINLLGMCFRNIYFQQTMHVNMLPHVENKDVIIRCKLFHRFCFLVFVSS
ncbi:Adenine phosphoribosyltransferase 1 [Platanthera guangdongensis]|uniref:adenine phosphoribosyltransferase n=1 Tax=Platanthera guangdongensis TaxID=2320717 RepID=A0ABR2MK14_9ASPA